MSEQDAVASLEAVDQKSLGFLDGARAVAALFVVVHHVYLHPPGVDTGRDVYHWQGAEEILSVFVWGHFAVSFFIVLSGFCLAIGPVRREMVPSTGDFLIRRAKRILPPYFGALLLSLVLIATVVGTKTGTHWDTSLPVTPRSLVCRVLLVNAFGPDDGLVNHVFWSIAVEWHLYFCFLPLLLLTRRFGWRRILVVLIPLVYLVARFAQNQGDSYSIPYLALFAFGMAAAHLVFSPHLAKLRGRFAWPLWSLTAFLLFVIPLEILPRVGHSQPYYRLDFLAGVAGALLLVALCLTPHSKLRRLLSARPLVYIGGFSYSIYLIHAPMIQIAWQLGINRLGNPRLEFWVLLVTSLPLAVLAAYLFYLVFERPFLPIKRRV
ncbi:hypothetical protein IAD21_02214 [Abditibacteriota bacterium]|nr:hypothetical protein IAD21_02214 [Abditibacteriota bacterium]